MRFYLLEAEPQILDDEEIERSLRTDQANDLSYIEKQVETELNSLNQYLVSNERLVDLIVSDVSAFGFENSNMFSFVTSMPKSVSKNLSYEGIETLEYILSESKKGNIKISKVWIASEDYRSKFLYSPTLYDRNVNDARFAVNAYEILDNSHNFDRYIYRVEWSPAIVEDILFDTRGYVKPTGNKSDLTSKTILGSINQFTNSKGSSKSKVSSEVAKRELRKLQTELNRLNSLPEAQWNSKVIQQITDLNAAINDLKRK